MELQRFRNKASSETLRGQNLETVFEREKEKWRMKMSKIFGDLYPYDFCVAYGHSDGVHSADDTVDISKKVSLKTYPFERLQEIHDVNEQIAKEFYKILSDMEVKVTTSSLKEVLIKRKKECQNVFEQYDEIIALCEKYFDLEYKDCMHRAAKQTEMQNSMVDGVQRYLSEVEKSGEKEIINLKDSISSHMREMGMLWSDKVENIYKEINDQPSPMEVLSRCAEAISCREAQESFIEDQQATSREWKKAFDDLLMLSAELQRYRCSYNLTKSNLERAIYWMNRNYRDNMPKLTKTQRQIALLVDRKSSLLKSLADTEEKIRKEKEEHENIKLKYYNKISGLRTSNKLAYDRTIARHKNIFEVKKTEVLDLLTNLLSGDEVIYKEILDMAWYSADLSFLEEAEIKNQKTSDSELQFAHEVSPKTIKTLHEDDFAEAYRELVCCGNFETLLNHIAEELGYMLDFRWVDYAKETLKLKNEIRWLELFKVFKIDFADDLKELKDHMKKYSKNKEGEATFDISRALEGFLNFVVLKRQSAEVSDLELDKIHPQLHKDFWDLVDTAIPKSLLWDSVLELLKKYRMLLQSREKLVTMRSCLVKENEELDNYLKNFNSFDVPS